MRVSAELNVPADFDHLAKDVVDLAPAVDFALHRADGEFVS